MTQATTILTRAAIHGPHPSNNHWPQEVRRGVQQDGEFQTLPLGVPAYLYNLLDNSASSLLLLTSPFLRYA
jgi:hypothetical protein